MKLCACGCGQPTPVADRTRPERGLVKGEPREFIPRHAPVRRREVRKRLIRSDGYVYLYEPQHPCADAHGKVLEHIVVVVSAHGGNPLPPRARVHHVNSIRSDNRPANLVVCEDAAYHSLLHRRERALRECGHADWRKCRYCHQWDAPENLVDPCARWPRVRRASLYHAECMAERDRKRTAAAATTRRAARAFDPTRIPGDSERQFTPGMSDAAYGRAISNDDLMREHCE